MSLIGIYNMAHNNPYEAHNEVDSCDNSVQSSSIQSSVVGAFLWFRRPSILQLQKRDLSLLSSDQTILQYPGPFLLCSRAQSDLWLVLLGYLQADVHPQLLSCPADALGTDVGVGRDTPGPAPQEVQQDLERLGTDVEEDLGLAGGHQLGQLGVRLQSNFVQVLDNLLCTVTCWDRVALLVSNTVPPALTRTRAQAAFSDTCIVPYSTVLTQYTQYSRPEQ